MKHTMYLKNIYTSSACNQATSILDWGSNGLICYGACNSVLIYDPKLNNGGIITHTLVKHTKRVNAVSWIKGVDYETECVSVSTDGTAIVWTLKDDVYIPHVLSGQNSIINAACAVYRDPNLQSLVVFTAADNSTIRVWTRASLTEEFVDSYTLNLGYNICLSIGATFFPGAEILLLACALNDSKVHLYCEEGEPDLIKPLTFKKILMLRGHEDWVQGLDFKLDDKNELLLATSSQDAFIRLWRIVSLKNEEMGLSAENALKVGHQLLATDVGNFSVVLESVLTGHEGWVYSVHWSSTEMKLLSASIDKSLIIWEYNKSLGVWMDEVRVGEVGGNTLGFYGGKFGPNGKEIIGHGYLGSFHMWNLTDENVWQSMVTIGGHFKEVTSLEWEPKGEFLVSISEDETTRIHAPWVQFDSSSDLSWHEIARPQIHGYSMSCLAMLSRYSFVSGADEKVIRVFKAPKNYVENFRRICKIVEDEEGDAIVESNDRTGPQGASVPSLGLSNKAIYENDNLSGIKSTNKDAYAEESYFTATELEEPPTEETLLQNTLWPEVQKLYGHGYELFALAASPISNIVASACKATTAEHASIILWNKNNWEKIQKLKSHTLTVAQMAFSPNGKHLLSVSRDRRWSLFSKKSENEFELSATTDKKNGIHARIIWTCGWTMDSKYFITGSRDGKVVVWSLEEAVQGKCTPASTPLELASDISVTAVAFTQIDKCVLSNNDKYLLAIGLESGIVMIYWWNVSSGFEFAARLDQSQAHHLTVKRIHFRPVLGQAGVNEEENVDNCDKKVLQFASCSSDNSVRVFNIYLS